MLRLDEMIMLGTDDLGPVNTPLTETPEPKRGVFSRSEGTPYFEESHIITPKRTPRVTKTPQPRYQVQAEVVTGEEYYEGSEDKYDNLREIDEGSNSHILHDLALSLSGDAKGNKAKSWRYERTRHWTRSSSSRESAIVQTMSYNGSGNLTTR